MPDIRLCKLGRGDDVLVIEPSKTAALEVTQAVVDTWKVANPTATKDDLATELLRIVSAIDGVSVYIHVFDLKTPNIAVLCTKEGVKPDRLDWWFSEDPGVNA